MWPRTKSNLLRSYVVVRGGCPHNWSKSSFVELTGILGLARLARLKGLTGLDRFRVYH